MNSNCLIIDDDSHFIINAITREISSTTQPTIMQYDHKAEILTFTLPRYIEGHDMSTCNKVEVHYVNGNISGIYEVLDLTIVEQSEQEMVTFSWAISNNATQNIGSLNFAIRLACVEEEEITYQWLTKPYNLNITKSLFNLDTAINQGIYIDILENWQKNFSNTGFDYLSLYDAITDTKYSLSIIDGELVVQSIKEEDTNEQQ